MKKIEIFELPNGIEPYQKWFDLLDPKIQLKVDIYVKRLAAGGSKKNVRSLKDGIYEMKINVGPGYRVYFGEIGHFILLLLAGGDKRTQFRDVVTAKKYWREYVQKG